MKHEKHGAKTQQANASPLSHNADRTVLQIWRWNVKAYSENHANEYIQFLIKRTNALETGFLEGRVVPTNPAFRYKTFRKSSHGHGHVVIYKVKATEVYVVDFFHTAQDWHTYVKELGEE